MTRLLILALSVALLAIPAVSSTAVAGKGKPKCNGLVATKVGSNRSQVIRGTDKRDVIVAKGGVDRIFGEGGNDVICAGPGNDVIDGGRGKDQIFASDGDDVLRGGRGKDLLDGGKGKDACYPAAGGDRLRSCEDADLEVSIETPASVSDDDAIEFTVLVRNRGAKRSGPYDLVISMVQNNVVCREDVTGTTTHDPLWPGAPANPEPFEIAGGCIAQPPQCDLVIEAAVESSVRDADATNDEAAARIAFDTCSPTITLPLPEGS